MQSYSAELLNDAAGPSNGAGVEWNGGRGLLTASGTFGGTSLTMEYLGAGNVWFPVQAMAPDATFTTVALSVAGAFLFELPPGRIRAVTAGGTPSAMFARADRIPY